MNFMTSANFDVAVKLLASATVKGGCFVEEERDMGERRNKISKIETKKCLLSYFIMFSFPLDLWKIIKE